jgi:hypothetical protein
MDFSPSKERRASTSVEDPAGNVLQDLAAESDEKMVDGRFGLPFSVRKSFLNQGQKTGGPGRQTRAAKDLS